MKRLIECKYNKFYTLKAIDGEISPKLRRRLLDLGFTSGQKIKILYRSLLGKTYLLQLRDYTLSMRDRIVRTLLVEGGDD